MASLTDRRFVFVKGDTVVEYKSNISGKIFLSFVAAME